MAVHPCRCCGHALHETFVDLGETPLANSFVSPENAGVVEASYPLHALVCSKCRLVQLPQVKTPESIFGRYLYYSPIPRAGSGTRQPMPTR